MKTPGDVGDQPDRRSIDLAGLIGIDEAQGCHSLVGMGTEHAGGSLHANATRIVTRESQESDGSMQIDGENVGRARWTLMVPLFPICHSGKRH